MAILEGAKDPGITSTRLKEFLSEKRLRATGPRRAVAEAILSATGSVTVQEVLHRARLGEPRTGISTLYRTLALLVREGLATRRASIGNETRYEAVGGRPQNVQLICLTCLAVVDCSDAQLRSLGHEVAQRHGF